MKISGIQSLRGLAALLVVFHHLSVLSAKEKYFGEGVFGFLGSSGFRGVDLFFVVSGFIMMHTRKHRPGQTRGGFARNRLIRVYVPYLPCFLVMTLAYLAMPSIAQGGIDIDGWYFVQNLLLLPRENLETYVPVVAWTLSLELTFYLVFALTLLKGGRGAMAVFMLWMVACAANAIFTDLLPTYMILDPLNLGFGIGILSFLLAERVPASAGRPAFLLGILLFTGLMALETDRADNRSVDLGFLLVSGLLCVSSTRIPQNFLGTIGNFSYSLYLIHYPLLALMFIVTFRLQAQGPLDRYGMAGIGILICLLASWVFFRVMEVWLCGLIRRRASPAA